MGEAVVNGARRKLICVAFREVIEWPKDVDVEAKGLSLVNDYFFEIGIYQEGSLFSEIHKSYRLRLLALISQCIIFVAPLIRSF